ncbi:hypothetical protein ABT008_26530 [Micromonospora sp. NPDC002389]|uniref:hypothetical protein n=1 Tax=Micromonospora sp. NPDC002389 TaxID=3154272 RepID=UPI003326746F
MSELTVRSMTEMELNQWYSGLVRAYADEQVAAGEDVVRRHGIAALELNMFGDNDRARRLYQSSGYRVVTQQMRKTLTGEAR